jgi:anti-sigma B factor antagonist
MSEAATSAVTVSPEGNIIGTISRRFREELTNVLAAGAINISIDMHLVQMIDSTGIGAIVGVQKVLSERGGGLVLTGVSDDIQMMVKIMHLDKHLTIR